MRTGERNSLARKLALVLRHAPEKFDLEMDINGWIDVKDIIRQFKKGGKRFHWLRPHHFTAIAETDPKGRYEVRGNTMRATYGHTVEIELDLPTDNIPDSLYFPCDPEQTENLLEAYSVIGDRTDFKGQSQLPYRVVSEDPMCDPKGNFYHYHWQG